MAVCGQRARRAAPGDVHAAKVRGEAKEREKRNDSFLSRVGMESRVRYLEHLVGDSPALGSQVQAVQHTLASLEWINSLHDSCECRPRRAR